MKLSLISGLEKLTYTVRTSLGDKFIFRIISTHKPHGDLSPLVYSFFFELNRGTASLGLSSRQGNGVEAIKRFKATFGHLQVWNCYIQVPKQFILIERHEYSGSILVAEHHKGYIFTGNIFAPYPSDTITSLSAPETKELRQLYAKLT